MLNINEYSKKPLYCTDSGYAVAKNCLEQKSLETLGAILLHRDDEIFTHENMISMCFNDEPVSIFLRDKRYVINSTLGFILRNVKRELNGKKLGMWPRVELVYDIYCSLNGSAPELSKRLEGWLERRQSYFTQQPVEKSADIDEFCGE